MAGGSRKNRQTVQKKSRRHGRCGQGPGSVGPRFLAGSPFPVPEILEFVAFRDPGNIFQQFSRNFPGVFLDNPRTDSGNSHSLLEFSDQCEISCEKNAFISAEIWVWKHEKKSQTYDPAGVVQGPKMPESRNKKIPPPLGGPQKYEKITAKIQKW